MKKKKQVEEGLHTQAANICVHYASFISHDWPPFVSWGKIL